MKLSFESKEVKRTVATASCLIAAGFLVSSCSEPISHQERRQALHGLAAEGYTPNEFTVYDITRNGDHLEADIAIKGCDEADAVLDLVPVNSKGYLVDVEMDGDGPRTPKEFIQEFKEKTCQ